MVVVLAFPDIVAWNKTAASIELSLLKTCCCHAEKGCNRFLNALLEFPSSSALLKRSC